MHVAALEPGLSQAGLETLQGRAALCLPLLLIFLFKCWIPEVMEGRSSSPVIYKVSFDRAVSEGGLGCTVSDQRYKKSPGFQEH